MRNRVYNLFVMLLIGLAPILAACAGGGESTGPEAKTSSEVEVRYMQDIGCNLLSTPMDSVNMGVVEFTNVGDVPVVPTQIAAKLTTSTNASVKMYFFNPSWRNMDNSITPNVDAQTDPVGSYLRFGTIPPIAPGGKFVTKLRGMVPDPTPGIYAFAIMPESTKVENMDGDSVKVTIKQGEFALTLHNSCT